MRNKIKQYQTLTTLSLTYLHLSDFVVVAILHLCDLPLQSLVVAPEGLDLQGAGLHLPAVLTQLLLRVLDGVLVAGSRLSHGGKLGAVPVLCLGLVPGRQVLILNPDVLQGGSQVRLAHVHLHGHLNVGGEKMFFIRSV